MSNFILKDTRVFMGLGLVILLVLAALGYWSYAQVKTPTVEVVVGSSVFTEIAKEKGYFRQKGLNVKTIEYNAGPEQMAGLLQGDINFAVVSDFVGVDSIFKDDSLRIIAQVASRDLFRVIARKDKGVVNPSDLKGKRIGVTRRSAGEFYLSRFLIEQRIDLAEIHIVNLTPQEMMDQIATGKIDALVTLDPTAYAIQKNLGDNALSWSAQGDEMSKGLAYTTDSYIEAHPDTVRRFIAALVETEESIKENEEKVRQFVAKKYDYDEQYMEHYWPTFDFTVTLDQSLLLGIEEQARFLIDNKRTDKAKVPNFLDFIYFDALQSVKPGAVTIIY